MQSETQRKEREAKEPEIESLEKILQLKNEEIQNLKQKEKELIQIKREKEEYITANHRQRSKIISLEQDIGTLRNERDSTQSQNRSLIQQNNQLKVKQSFMVHSYHNKVHDIFRIK